MIEHVEGKRLAVCLTVLAGLLAPADAAPYIEHFLHVKPDEQDLSAFRLDRYVENEAYEVSFDKMLNVRDMRLILKADTAQGLSRSILAAATKPEIADSHYVSFTVALAVQVDNGPNAEVFSGSLVCQAAQSAEAYGVSGPGLLC